MNDFPAPESLATLAAAREAYGKLLAAFHEKDGQSQQLEADLKAASALIDENAQTVSKLQEGLKAKDEALEQATHERATAQQTIQTLEGQAKALEAKIAALEAGAKSAEEEAASICASVGVDPLQIKPDTQPGQPDLMEQFQAIKDPGQRTAFFRKHKDKLLSRL